MQKVSNKQALRNRELAKIKRSLSTQCCVCGRLGATDLMHLLPKSIFPEYYTEPRNLALGHRDCHNDYDNTLAFRQRCKGLFLRVFEFEPRGAMRYFNLNEKGE